MITDPTNAREAAVRRLTARRELVTHAVTFAIFNIALVVVWTVTGHGYFWPGWILGLWGAGLAIHAWDVWGRRPISDEDIRREVDRHSGSLT